jgi:dolichyl-phosphate-mannose--protein O-mannosyl transferase
MERFDDDSDLSIYDFNSIINYIKNNIIQILLLILVFFIIYVVDYICNINTMLMTTSTMIPSIPQVQIKPNIIKMPKGGKKSKK